MRVRLSFVCVEDAITKVLPHISRERAYEIALQAHTYSSATIMLTWEEKAKDVAVGKANHRHSSCFDTGERVVQDLRVHYDCICSSPERRLDHNNPS